jgi:hypothetical protein
LIGEVAKRRDLGNARSRHCITITCILARNVATRDPEIAKHGNEKEETKDIVNPSSAQFTPVPNH